MVKIVYCHILKRAATWVKDNPAILVLLFMVVLGATTSDVFFTWANISNLLNRICINGIMTVGFTCTLLVGGFDLSIGSSMALSGLLCIGVEKSTGLPAAGMVAAIGAGAGMGLLNGILMKITRGRFGEAFLITVGTNLVGLSIAMTYTRASDLYGTGHPWYKALGQGTVGGFPVATLLWFGIMIAMQILIKKTKFGRDLLYTGTNRNAAYLSGINVNNKLIISFTLAGIFAAVSGILMAARTTAASPQSGVGADFDAAVSTIIGGNSIVDGRGGMLQVLMGVLIYGLITNILNLLGVASVVQYIIKGLILLFAICLDMLRKR